MGTKWGSGRDQMLSVRVYPQTMATLTDQARKAGLSRSDLVRDILQRWAEDK